MVQRRNSRSHSMRGLLPYFLFHHQQHIDTGSLKLSLRACHCQGALVWKWPASLRMISISIMQRRKFIANSLRGLLPYFLFHHQLHIDADSFGSNARACHDRGALEFAYKRASLNITHTTLFLPCLFNSIFQRGVCQWWWLCGKHTWIHFSGKRVIPCKILLRTFFFTSILQRGVSALGICEVVVLLVWSGCLDADTL